MHSEYFSINEEASKIINSTRKNGGRVIAVGTTSCRALETVGSEDGYVEPGEGNTDISYTQGISLKSLMD